MTYDEFVKQWSDGNDNIECHTSGSTGLPKNIWLPKQQMLHSAQRTMEYFGLGADAYIYSCLSCDTIGGKMVTVRSLTAGCRFGYETPSNRPFENIPIDTCIDMVSMVPSQIRYFIDNYNRLPRPRIILSGGASISDTLRKEIAESGLNVYEGYGMTETSSHIALRKVTSESAPFVTLGGITVSADADHRLLIDIPGWQTFATNDIAEILSPRQFHILGRADNVINSGGKKIHAELLEQKLSPLFDFDFYITGTADDKWGEIVTMIAEQPNLSVDEIIAKCRTVCERHENPKLIKTVTSLPRTTNGKLKRNTTLSENK